MGRVTIKNSLLEISSSLKVGMLSHVTHMQQTDTHIHKHAHTGLVFYITQSWIFQDVTTKEVFKEQ